MAYTTPQMCSVWVKDAGNPTSFTVRGTTPKKSNPEGTLLTLSVIISKKSFQVVIRTKRKA